MTREELAFEQEERGFRIQVWYTDGSDAEVLIERNGERLRHFMFPAYKIWNLSAHFSDIVDSELAKNVEGYAEAASTGFGGSVGFKPVEGDDE